MSEVATGENWGLDDPVVQSPQATWGLADPVAQVAEVTWGRDDPVVKPAPPVEREPTPSILPRFIQEGYNRSITGLTEQIVTGEKRFDLSGYEPSTIEDIGATVASFLMPIDLVLTAGTGFLATAPARLLARQTAAQLVKAGVKSQVAKKMARAGVARAVQGAAVLGPYSGAQSAAMQQAEFGEIDPGEVAKATLKGTLTGAIAGGAGGAVAGRGLGKIAQISAEVGAFGTAVPVIERRTPTSEDYIHAAGVILGLRAVHTTASTGMKALRKSIGRDIKNEVEGGEGGGSIEDAIEIVGERRRSEIQAQRAIEAPDVPAEPLKPRIRPKPRIEPELPPEVQSVRDTFSKQEADIRASNKVDTKSVYAELKRKVVDVRANVRQKFLKEGGDEGRQVVVKFDTVAGAPSWAKLEYFRAEKEIFRLSPPEETMLARVIQAKRSIELDRIFDERGEPRLEHPGGKGKESLEIWLDNERTLGPEMMKKVEHSAGLYFKEMRAQLDQLYSEGLLSRESYEACLEYQHYSPRRFIQHLDPDKSSFDPSGRPISIPDSGLRELTTGSEQSMMNNPRLLLMQTMARTQGRIFRNEANKSLHRYIQSNPDNGWVSIQEPKRVTKAGAPEYGKAPAGKSPISVVIEGRQNRMLMDNKFAKEWLIRDPEISAQLSNTIRILSGSFILRPMATGINPEFAIANLPRDIAHIMLTTQEYSSTLPVGLGQMVKDIGTVGWDAIRRKGRYVDYAREGGLMEFLTHQGRIAREGAQPLRAGFLKSLRNTLEYVGETSEVLTRLALRERAIINGRSTQEATWIARNYLDFAQGGSLAKAVDAGIPYLNAAVQGTRGIVRAAVEKPGVFTYKVAQIGGLATMLYLANRKHNPEAWDQISDQQKVANWIITTPFYKIDKDGRKRYKYITIAKDQGQRVFASLFEALSERSIEGKMPRKQILASIADFLPLVPTQALPPTLEAIMGYAMNKDFWYREDIWRGPKVEPKEEYWAGTHPAFVKFGEATRTSPIRMQYALGNIFTRRNIYTDLAGAGWETITGALDDEQNAAVLKEMKGVPFARRMFKETNPMYEDVEDLERMSIEENTRRHRQNREMSEIYALTEVEKEELRLAVSETARKRIYQVRTSERNAEFREFIKQQPATDRQRLINRRNAMQRHIGLSNWWYDMMELPPEPRAAAFYSRWYESDPETREELIKTARRIGGIMSGRFMASFRRLAKEEMDNATF